MHSSSAKVLIFIFTLICQSVLQPFFADSYAVATNTQHAAPYIPAKVVGTLPHAPDHFTQGLFFSGSYLYESVGRYGESAFFRLNKQSGKVLEARHFQNYFVEGSAALNGMIHLLTWQDGLRMLLDESGLRVREIKKLSGEGWGLCSDGQSLWLSDGSAVLRRLSSDWEELEHLSVSDAGHPVSHLNELEWVNGLLFANVWQDNRIAVIDPQHRVGEGEKISCPVLFWLDCSALVPPQYNKDPEAVLNGIAWDAETGRLLVTGKLWPLFYQLELPSILSPHYAP